MENNRGEATESGQIGLLGFLGGSWMNWLLLFVPVSLVFDLLGFPKLWVFAVSCIAIVPLAALLGELTDQLAQLVGPGLGGLLSAAFGNATELIIALFALRAGLFEVVKASISGSIIGNLLLVMGLAMLVGGWGRAQQTFNRTRAGASVAMLFLAVVALVMPAVFDVAIFGSLIQREQTVDFLSLLVSVVLIATYLASLVFSLKTHRDLITSSPLEPLARLSSSNIIVLLVVVTIAVAVEAELLVGAISEATAALGITNFFVGVVVVAVVGNVAEQYTAVLMARRNYMDLSVTIATGASTQIALFVAPLLVFASFLFGSPMSLVFNAFEIVGIVVAVLLISVVSLDGESNWFEGLQLIAVYLVLAIVFYFVPVG